MAFSGYRIRRQFLILLSMLVNFIVLSLSLCSMLWWFPIRLTVNYLARKFRPDLNGPLTGPSSVLAGKSRRSKPRNFCGGYVLEGDFDLEQSLALFEDRVLERKKPDGGLVYPELRHYWAPFMNYYFWKADEDFSVRNHVRHYDYDGELKVPDPCTEEDFRRIMGGLLAKGWPEARSPWELLIVENFISETPKRTKDRHTLVIFRVHHGLGDGYSFLNVFLRDLAQYKGNLAKPVRPRLTKIEQIIAILISPVKMSYDLAELCVDAYDFGNCWRVKRGSKLSRQYYTSISKPIETQRMKVIKNKYGVNYISVILAALAGTIRKLMEDAEQSVPKRIALAVPMPLPNHPGGLVNHVSSFALKLPVAMVDHEKRLQEIFQWTRKSKYYMGPLATHMMTRLNYANTNWMNSTVAHNSMGFTVAVTSFPGPEEFFDLLGCRLIDTMFGVGKVPGTAAATVALVTAAGCHRFVMNIDKAVYPSEELFMKAATHFEDEVEIMHKLTLTVKKEAV